MAFPALTAMYAAILALIYMAISVWVVTARTKLNIVHGDGGSAPLNRRIRAHANFAEYVPLILLLIALLEAGGTGRLTIHALSLALVVGRLMHPIGMVAAEGSTQQFAFRAPAMALTWTVMVAAAVLLLLRAL